MLNKLNNLKPLAKFFIMFILGLVLSVAGWSYYNTPLMPWGLLLFVVAGRNYFYAYKFLKEVLINNH